MAITDKKNGNNDERTVAERKADFLIHFIDTGNVTRAAKATHIDRQTVYRWKKEDPEFDVQFEQANELAGYGLEDTAHERAKFGVPVITKNGTYQHYSDTLLIVLLKARFPEKYREIQKLDVTSNGQAILDGGNDSKVIATLTSVFARALERKETKRKAAAALPALPSPIARGDDDEDYSDIC